MIGMRKLGMWAIALMLCVALAGGSALGQDAPKKGKGKGKGKRKAKAAAQAPVAAEEGFVSLFDGKTTEGWEGDPAVWSVKDGMIVGNANMIKANNFLSTKKEYSDFILRVQIKLVDQKGNTGVQFRSIKIPNTPSMAGFQADFADVEKYCGMLYDERRRGILLQPKPETIKLKPGDWNDIEVTAEGDHIQISLNGVQTIDYTEKQTQDPKTKQEIWKKGFIGLQAHAGKVMEVQFKNLRIKELTK